MLYRRALSIGGENVEQLFDDRFVFGEAPLQLSQLLFVNDAHDLIPSCRASTSKSDVWKMLNLGTGYL